MSECTAPYKSAATMNKKHQIPCELEQNKQMWEGGGCVEMMVVIVKLHSVIIVGLTPCPAMLSASSVESESFLSLAAIV